MEQIYLGFDISTTCIGISIFGTSGQLIHIEHLVLKSDKMILPQHRIFAKANTFNEFIQKYKNYEVMGIFIEEPLIASNNQYTSNLLMKFNGICSYILLRELNILPEYKSVHDIRRLLCPELLTTKIVKGKQKDVLSFPKDIKGKEYVFNKIKSIYKDIEWINNKKGDLATYNYDMSDAIAVCRAFLIELKIIK